MLLLSTWTSWIVSAELQAEVGDSQLLTIIQKTLAQSYAFLSPLLLDVTHLQLVHSLLTLHKPLIHW